MCALNKRSFLSENYGRTRHIHSVALTPPFMLFFSLSVFLRTQKNLHLNFFFYSIKSLVRRVVCSSANHKTKKKYLHSKSCNNYFPEGSPMIKAKHNWNCNRTQSSICPNSPERKRERGELCFDQFSPKIKRKLIAHTNQLLHDWLLHPISFQLSTKRTKKNLDSPPLSIWVIASTHFFFNIDTTCWHNHTPVLRCLPNSPSYCGKN